MFGSYCKSLLGLFAEEIDPTSGEQLGNFSQAFSHIGVLNVAVSLAHVGHIGDVQPQHQIAAATAGRGGGEPHRKRDRFRLPRHNKHIHCLRKGER